jgi:hypothetical protein
MVSHITTRQFTINSYILFKQLFFTHWRIVTNLATIMRGSLSTRSFFSPFMSFQALSYAIYAYTFSNIDCCTFIIQSINTVICRRLINIFLGKGIFVARDSYSTPPFTLSYENYTTKKEVVNVEFRNSPLEDWRRKEPF